jgi:hypothetical protein
MQMLLLQMLMQLLMLMLMLMLMLAPRPMLHCHTAQEPLLLRRPVLTVTLLLMPQRQRRLSS